MSLKRNQFNKDKFCDLVRKRYKKRFKKGMDASDGDIMKVVNNELERIKEAVSRGKQVKFDKHSYMRVIGTPVLEHKQFKQAVMKGKYIVNGGMKKANNMNSKRSDAVYGIKYFNKLSKEKIYFTAHPSFKKKVSEELRTNNNYYEVK